MIHKDIMPKRTIYSSGKNGYPGSNDGDKKTIRCSLCGKVISYNIAYCVIEGPKKTFCCSREEYEGGQEYVANRLKYENSIEDCVRRILNCDGFDISVYNTSLTLWLKEAPYKKIYYYLLDNEETLRDKLSRKSFDNNTIKLKYLSAIILREVVNYKLSVSKNLVTVNTHTNQIDYTNYVPKLTPRKGIRRSMEELENEYGEDDDKI